MLYPTIVLFLNYAPQDVHITVHMSIGTRPFRAPKAQETRNGPCVEPGSGEARQI